MKISGKYPYPWAAGTPSEDSGIGFKIEEEAIRHSNAMNINLEHFEKNDKFPKWDKNYWKEKPSDWIVERAECSPEQINFQSISEVVQFSTFQITTVSKVLDNDNDGKLGSDKRQVSFTIDYRLLELLENEDKLSSALLDKIKEHFNSVRNSLKHP